VSENAIALQMSAKCKEIVTFSGYSLLFMVLRESNQLKE
jgi:hypothetical protein